MTTPSADALTREQMIHALAEAGNLSGSLGQQAAMHLLGFTGLPGRADFGRHVDVAEEQTRDGSPVVTARIRDWRALLDDKRMYLTGGDHRLLALAASWAAGVPVDLSACANGLGTAHARRVIESTIIGSGMTGFYTLADGPELAELHAFHASIADGQAPARPDGV